MAKGAVYATPYQISRMDVWFAKTTAMVEKNARRYVMTAISSTKRLQNNSFPDFSNIKSSTMNFSTPEIVVEELIRGSFYNNVVKKKGVT